MTPVSERFLRYVGYYTTSDEFSESCPSTDRQKELGKALVAEMLAMDDRSYSDIEKGISSCSVVTLVIFIAFVLEDSVQKEELFKELRESIEKAWLETYNTK